MVYQCKIIYLLNAAIKPFQHSLKWNRQITFYVNVTKNVRLHFFSNLCNGDFTYQNRHHTVKKDWCGWKFVMICHKVFTSKINAFHSISVDFSFAQCTPWNCYNFPGMAFATFQTRKSVHFHVVFCLSHVSENLLHVMFEENTRCDININCD